MSGFISPVQYNQARLLAVSFEVFHNPTEIAEQIDMSESRREFEVTRSYRTGENDERYAVICRLDLDMNVTEKEAPEDNPVARFVCSFEVLATAPKDSEQEEDIKRFLVANAIAFLWGKMRDLCESISTTTSTGKITLPAIDPYLILNNGEAAGAAEIGLVE